jgi:hypothetical protein
MGTHVPVSPAAWIEEPVHFELAQEADRNAAAREAAHYSWSHCTGLFLTGLAAPTAAEDLPRAA